MSLGGAPGNTKPVKQVMLKSCQLLQAHVKIINSDKEEHFKWNRKFQLASEYLGDPWSARISTWGSTA